MQIPIVPHWKHVLWHLVACNEAYFSSFGIGFLLCYKTDPWHFCVSLLAAVWVKTVTLWGKMLFLFADNHVKMWLLCCWIYILGWNLETLVNCWADKLLGWFIACFWENMMLSDFLLHTSFCEPNIVCDLQKEIMADERTFKFWGSIEYK